MLVVLYQGFGGLSSRLNRPPYTGGEASQWSKSIVLPHLVEMPQKLLLFGFKALVAQAVNRTDRAHVIDEGDMCGVSRH